MLNILIADDNLYYAKALMNYINANNENIRVCNISIDGKETLDLLNSSDKIDMFLLDLKMPVYTGMEILEKLDEDKKIKYEKSCIVISGELNMINEIIGNSIVYSYMYKSCSFSKIMTSINNLIQEKNEAKDQEWINAKIDKELKTLHFNNSYLGTKYLKECILYIIKDMNNDFENLRKEVYPNVAFKHHKTVHNIKCNINSAVNAMYFDCEKEVIIEYFNFFEDYKPTTKIVISTIISKIRK